jgi:hypothetical protein
MRQVVFAAFWRDLPSINGIYKIMEMKIPQQFGIQLVMERKYPIVIKLQPGGKTESDQKSIYH